MKRAFDLLTATMGLFLLLPLLLVVALILALTVGRPVFFTQLRPGKGGKPFQMVKFRTMTNERNPDGSLLPDALRLTRFGAWLRSTSLDELPELLNVVKGEMSLVGPRPLLMEYLPLYSAEQARRHEVRPGITGWAQVNGRNAVTWEDRLEMDIWYVKNHDLWLDLKILCRTLLAVVRRDGVNNPGHATMPRFQGSGETNEP
ncbi:MAG: sugar transferase [Gemmatimonadales bacterium]|nr:MAG: sugar transferase [Gemmatimonadales bacterium]